MPYETLQVERKDQVTTITLNRPKSKNAMNPQMHFDMCDALAEVERDDECRVLVLTGAGDAFCAGMDVKEYFLDTEENPVNRASARKAAFEWMFTRLRLLPKPTDALLWETAKWRELDAVGKKTWHKGVKQFKEERRYRPGLETYQWKE